MAQLASTKLGRGRAGTPSRGWRIAGVGTIVSLILLLTISTDADAALWVRITLDPSRPTAGASSRVSVLSFYLTQGTPDANRCANDPTTTPIPYAVQGQAFGTFELEVSKADDPSERTVVLLARRANDPAHWDGSVTFPSPGSWSLRLLRPGFPEPAVECAGAKTVVTVLPAVLPAAGAGGGPDDNLPLIGAILALTSVLLAGATRSWCLKQPSTTRSLSITAVSCRRSRRSRSPGRTLINSCKRAVVAITHRA